MVSSRAMSQSVSSMNFTPSLGGKLNPPLPPLWSVPPLSPSLAPPLTTAPQNQRRMRCVCFCVCKGVVCVIRFVLPQYLVICPFYLRSFSFFCSLLFLMTFLSLFLKLCHSSSPVNRPSSYSSSSSHPNPRPLPKTPSVHWPENMVTYREPSPLPDSPPPLPVKKHHRRHSQVKCVYVCVYVFAYDLGSSGYVYNIGVFN